MDYDPDISILSDSEVYPPSDDSILLIESLDVHPGEKVLEIGCGSGIVSIHCAKNGCSVTAGDINPRAINLTRRNANENRVEFPVIETDVYSGIEGRFDTIVFNLPYLPVEEEGLLEKAWSGGLDGLGPLPRLLSTEHLEKGGRIVVVVSSLMDQDALRACIKEWSVKAIGELKLFFEVLSVLELRPRTS